MARNGADILIDSLIAWGVDTIFGLPGDGVNGVMEAIRTRQDCVRFVQVRHEESSALMACAHAKITGRLGCCLATTGPGGIHLLNVLYDDKAADLLNAAKRVAILAGQGARHARSQLLLTADRLAAPIAKALLGKAVVPDDDPLTTGGIGLLGTRPSQEAMEGCDALLIVGS